MKHLSKSIDIGTIIEKILQVMESAREHLETEIKKILKHPLDKVFQIKCEKDNI